MNKTFGINTFMRMFNDRILMEFSDHESITKCQRCNDSAKHYYYIPVLNNMYICPRCHSGWYRNWGIIVFKEMINNE